MPKRDLLGIWPKCLLTLVVSMFLVFSLSAQVAAQGCFEFDDLLTDWRNDSDAQPFARRAMGVRLAKWRGVQFIYLNEGNGLYIFKVRNPPKPQLISMKKFCCNEMSCPCHPPADYDWLLYNFSVCHNCRYGVGHHWMGGPVLFDLGVDDAQPYISAVRAFDGENTVEGAFTFRQGNYQYLIINKLKKDGQSVGTCSFGQAELYLFDGIESTDLTSIQCIETIPGQSVNVMNGLHLVNSRGQKYIYLIQMSSTQVHIYKITGTGADLRLEYEGQPFTGVAKYGSSIRADIENDLLVTLYGLYEPQLWDISDLGTPQLIDSGLENLVEGELGVAAIRYPLLWLGQSHSGDSWTFDISDPQNPIPLDQQFWDPAHEWNSYDMQKNIDAEFSLDGRALFLARYSVFEHINATDCIPEVPDGGTDASQDGIDGGSDSGLDAADLSGDQGSDSVGDIRFDAGADQDQTADSDSAADSCSCRSARAGSFRIIWLFMVVGLLYFLAGRRDIKYRP
jgi:MYXO-CTERM domain-containing protein